MSKKFKILFLIIVFSNIESKQLHILPFFDSNAALTFIKQFLPDNPNILEAGAFDGTETFTMSDLWPRGKIYAFEPVPKIFQWLTQKTYDCKNVFRFMYALSDKNGVAKFHLSEDPSNPDVPTTSGSLFPAKNHLKLHFYVFRKTILVKTITLDDWAKKNNVDHVDLLWLDMQGAELMALKSGLNLLKKVKVIYTEAEFTQAYDGQPMYKELKSWLEQQGFELIATDRDGKTQAQWCCNLVFINRNLI